MCALRQISLQLLISREYNTPITNNPFVLCATLIPQSSKYTTSVTQMDNNLSD